MWPSELCVLVWILQWPCPGSSPTGRTRQVWKLWAVNKEGKWVIRSLKGMGRGKKTKRKGKGPRGRRMGSSMVLLFDIQFQLLHLNEWLLVSAVLHGTVICFLWLEVLLPKTEKSQTLYAIEMTLDMWSNVNILKLIMELHPSLSSCPFFPVILFFPSSLFSLPSFLFLSVRVCVCVNLCVTQEYSFVHETLCPCNTSSKSALRGDSATPRAFPCLPVTWFTGSHLSHLPTLLYPDTGQHLKIAFALVCPWVEHSHLQNRGFLTMSYLVVVAAVAIRVWASMGCDCGG